MKILERIKQVTVDYKVEKIILIIIFLLFAIAFFRVGEYWITVIPLGLLLLSSRLYDIREFSISLEGIKAIFNKKDKIRKVIESKESTEEKVQKSQKLIDEAFVIGYYTGTGKKPIGNISNVKIWKDEKTGVENFQYDEE